MYFQISGLNQLKYVIEPLVEDIPDSDTRTRTLNILKMNLYIFTQLHSATHDKIALESSTTVMEKVREFFDKCKLKD